MPVTVAVILECVRCAGLGSIVTAFGGWRSREQCRTMLQIERNVTLEMNGIAGIRAGGQINGASTDRSGSVNGSIDRAAINRLAITSGTKTLYVERDIREQCTL